MIRAAYKALRVIVGLLAARRGPDAFGRFVIRGAAHRQLARTMRRHGL